MPLLRHRTNSRDFAPEETPSGLIIRNPDGTVQYPAQIPPGVEFDVTSPGGTPQGTVRTTSTTNAPQLPAVKEETRGSAEAPRPKISRQWMTERPQPRSHPSVIPHLRRQGTNASALNQALWNNPYQHDDDSSSTSSSSSSSEDDEPVKPKKGAAAPPKRPAADAGRKGRGSQTSKASGAQVKDRHKYSRFAIGNEDFRTKGKVDRKDGRLNISVNETSNTGYLAKALGAGFLKHIGQTPATNAAAEDELVSPVTSPRGTFSRKSSDSQTGRKVPRPTLNIVVMVIGSRGDIQPFLRLGKILKEEHGHRVRIATHPAFRDFVQKDSGLEFFSVGGDPAELMAFMVKNPGMIPKMETVKAGEIGRRREQMSEMFEGFWRACINATDDEHDLHNLKMMGEMSPFVADAIIANPPCFAHIHCAERLGVPLHLMFTFPYTPTQAFPHPLANIKKTNVDPGYTNFMSYPLVEMMTWQGLGDLVNRFRVKTLGLEPVSTLWAPGQLYRLKVPYTYLWSPGLVPKPEDWGPEIDIAGFVFLDLASSFKPPKELTNFLDAGEPPVYIGFGSIVVDDPDKFTQMIFEAVKLAGVRALVSKGWGGLGGDSVPDGVYMLGNTPHDWLFPKVKAVVHHGGAGTTAIGLKCGKPSMIIPFFGDQQFWGNMMGRSGAGPDPVPYKNLTAEKLAEGIKYLLTDEAAEAAQKIARDIEREGDGAQNAVRSFHRSLNLRGEHSLRCSILEDRVAVWTMKNTSLRLSALAADILVAQRKLHWRQLRLVRHCEWNDFEGPGEPVTGMASAMFGSLAGIAGGIGSVPFRIHRSRKRRERHEEKKQRKLRQKQEKEDQKKSRSGKGAILAGKKEGVEVKDKAQPELKLETNGNGPNGSAKPNGAAKQSHGAATAPAKSNDKATAGPDLGKHTTVGSPIQEHNDRNHEPRDDETDGGDSILSADPEEDVAEVVAQDVGQGLAKSGEALLRAPMDISIAVAQGFHNAPRLYGDQTVRKPTRITGLHSGLKAAGEEFLFGIYDGVTGIVLQPYRGARDNGAVGFVKGVGMGLTGFVLKDLAAVVGPVGYTMKGIHKELGKKKQPTHFLRKARIRQGQRDWDCLKDEKQRREAEQMVLHGWSVVQRVWSVIAEEQHRAGVIGKVRKLGRGKHWREGGVFENVEAAEKALVAHEKGLAGAAGAAGGKNADGSHITLEEILERQREEIEARREKPRPKVVDEMEAKKDAIDDGKAGVPSSTDKPESGSGSGTSSSTVVNDVERARDKEDANMADRHGNPKSRDAEMEQLEKRKEDVPSMGAPLQVGEVDERVRETGVVPPREVDAGGRLPQGSKAVSGDLGGEGEIAL